MVPMATWETLNHKWCRISQVATFDPMWLASLPVLVLCYAGHVLVADVLLHWIPAVMLQLAVTMLLEPMKVKIVPTAR